MEKQSKSANLYSIKAAVEEPSIENIINTAVLIRSRVESRLFYTGQVTLRQYLWTKAGDVVSVDSQDAPALLEKMAGKKACCGGQPYHIFEEVN